eukprot:366130-Chlamydomonas_euryale.AAC.71
MFYHGQVRKYNYVLAMERNSKGRKIVGRARSSGTFLRGLTLRFVCARVCRRSVPAFFRLIKPGTGHAVNDIHHDSFRGFFKKIPDEEVFGQNNDGNGRLKTWWEEERARKRAISRQEFCLIGGNVMSLMSTISHLYQNPPKNDDYNKFKW